MTFKALTKLLHSFNNKYSTPYSIQRKASLYLFDFRLRLLSRDRHQPPPKKKQFCLIMGVTRTMDHKSAWIFQFDKPLCGLLHAHCKWQWDRKSGLGKHLNASQIHFHHPAATMQSGSGPRRHLNASQVHFCLHNAEGDWECLSSPPLHGTATALRWK